MSISHGSSRFQLAFFDNLPDPHQEPHQMSNMGNNIDHSQLPSPSAHESRVLRREPSRLRGEPFYRLQVLSSRLFLSQSVPSSSSSTSPTTFHFASQNVALASPSHDFRASASTPLRLAQSHRQLMAQSHVAPLETVEPCVEKSSSFRSNMKHPRRGSNQHLGRSRKPHAYLQTP